MCRIYYVLLYVLNRLCVRKKCTNKVGLLLGNMETDWCLMLKTAEFLGSGTGPGTCLYTVILQ